MGDLYIGGYTVGAPNTDYFNGTIDEVAVYWQPLDKQTIAGHFRVGADCQTTLLDEYAAMISGAPSIQCWWRLNESSGAICMDQVGSSHATKVGAWGSGAPLTSGAPDRSIALNGGYLNCGTSFDTSLPEMYAVECWIRPTQLPASGSAFIMSKTDAYELFLTSGGAIGYQASQPDGVGWITALSAAGKIAVQCTYHVVVNSDGTDTRLYVNDVEVATATALGAAPLSNYPLYVGGRGASSVYRGLIDELVIYGDALPRGTICDHYQVGTGGTLEGTPPVVPGSAPPPQDVPDTSTTAPYHVGTGVELTEDQA
jgi:hypothetical protein